TSPGPMLPGFSSSSSARTSGDGNLEPAGAEVSKNTPAIMLRSYPGLLHTGESVERGVFFTFTEPVRDGLIVFAVEFGVNTVRPVQLVIEGVAFRLGLRRGAALH